MSVRTLIDGAYRQCFEALTDKDKTDKTKTAECRSKAGKQYENDVGASSGSVDPSVLRGKLEKGATNEAMKGIKTYLHVNNIHSLTHTFDCSLSHLSC